MIEDLKNLKIKSAIPLNLNINKVSGHVEEVN